MHIVVLGTGMIGTTVVSELAKFKEINKVTAVDVFDASIEKCLNIANSEKVKGYQTTLETVDDIAKVLVDADVAVACLPHSLSLVAVKAAIKAKCHLVDLVGSKYNEKLAYDQKARDAGIIIVPGCGVAPGITNFLAAEGIDRLDEAEKAVMICGGIPRYPIPPLWYQVVFRLESVLGLYTKPAMAIEDGEIVELPPFSGLEKITFPYPVGECETVITDAHSTSFVLKNKVKTLYEKTVRYTGHWEKMKVLSELGFLDDTPLIVDGVQTTPRAFAEHILEPKMRGESNEDITVLRVEVSGLKNGQSIKYTWEMVDLYDHVRKITSMAKSTAVPAAITAKWIALNIITETGVMPIENLIIKDRFQPFLAEMNKLGIEIAFKVEILN